MKYTLTIDQLLKVQMALTECDSISPQAHPFAPGLRSKIVDAGGTVIEACQKEIAIRNKIATDFKATVLVPNPLFADAKDYNGYHAEWKARTETKIDIDLPEITREELEELPLSSGALRKLLPILSPSKKEN